MFKVSNVNITAVIACFIVFTFLSLNTFLPAWMNELINVLSYKFYVILISHNNYICIFYTWHEKYIFTLDVLSSVLNQKEKFLLPNLTI